MSRTIRKKKNGWDKSSFVDDWVKDDASINLLVRLCNKGKFHGCSKEKIKDKLNAYYHGETPKNWNYTKRAKQFCKWKLRAKNKHELIKFMKNGDEENIQLTMRREIFGEWIYYSC